MAERFYVNCDLRPGPVVLQGAEAHHLATVCRLRPGDAVCLFNGDGRQYPAAVVEVGKRAVTLQVQGSTEPRREHGFRLEVAAPLPRGDRAQFLLQKLTGRCLELRHDSSVFHHPQNSVVQHGRGDVGHAATVFPGYRCFRQLADLEAKPRSSFPASQDRVKGFGGRLPVSLARDFDHTTTAVKCRY